MTGNTLRTTLVLVLFFCACSSSSQGDVGANTSPGTTPPTRTRAIGEAVQVSYKRTIAGAMTKRAVSLCELASLFSTGGAYKVENIVGQTEPSLENPGTSEAYTYATLSLVISWMEGAPTAPVVRFRGGPLGGGITKSWDVSLEMGELLGVLLYAPTESNLGYYGVDQLGLFRSSESGGYSNGQLFTRNVLDLGQIGTMVFENSQGGLCKHQVLPDAANPFLTPERNGDQPEGVVYGVEDL